MSVLRVLLVAAPSPAHESPWALFDAHDRQVRSGVGPPASWPVAERREAVLAAAAVRLVGVALPPMPADRVAAAAAFALEDQLAGPANAQHLVASPRRRDGTVEVAIAARPLFPPLQRDFARVVAEPAVAPIPAPGTWRWYASVHDGGFVRRPDGSAFAVSTPDPQGPVPGELALALAQAARTGGTVARIDVAFPVDEAQLAAWTAQCSAPFKCGVAWRWDEDGTAITAATDLLQGDFSRQAPAISRSAASRVRWAAGLMVAALALQVGATIAQWLWLQIDVWQTGRAIVATARDAGVADALDEAAAATALARRFADARHRAGLTAPSDALPLLARAAPTLGALPAGVLKIATYSPGTWTFDLAKLDASVASKIDSDLAAAGLATLQATNNAGTRLRTTLAPGAELP
ncbi:MAG: type II secretion system protein GspL [Betaproteobacteria bacterium]